MPRLSRRRAAVLAALLSPVLGAAAAGAQQVVDGSARDLDAPLVGAITKLATRDFAAPADARLRGIHRSKARNGRGYCGQVAVGPDADFVPFHAIIEADGTASLLRFSDASEPADREAAIRLLTNFGCLE
ncbi:hypothetical protein [Kaistia adipata]|uniref:hypothetical protein n=1 Tax=Kaistia adipata TaxID=166954 RepID=UPI0004012A78|nr:hypothetical protein [Kaistia adipata]